MTGRSFAEYERLAAVSASGLMGSAAEERFDRIARLAASVFKVPMAFFSIVGHETQWLKSRYGIDIDETPRDIAFCPHVVDRESMLVVKDAREDPRFATNPLVTSGPRIRFYAGHPVKNPNGAVIGTLCIADRRAWASFTDQKAAALRDLASLVESELVLQAQTHREAPRSQHQALSAVQLRAMLDAGSAGKIVLDSERRVVAFNARATHYISLADDSVGHPIQDTLCLFEYPSLAQDLQDAVDHGHPSMQEVSTISGHLAVVRLTPFRPPQATRYHMVITITDVTASRDAERLSTVLDGLNGNRVCAVDRNGIIVYTNEAWDAHADSRTVPPLMRAGPGGHYIDLALARRSPHHRRVAENLRAVIEGQESRVSFRYDWSAVGEPSRFLLIHACAVSHQKISAVICHTDITDFLDDNRGVQSALSC